MSCDHKWECSDVPGMYICQCQVVRYYNYKTKEYYYEPAQ